MNGQLGLSINGGENFIPLPGGLPKSRSKKKIKAAAQPVTPSKSITPPRSSSKKNKPDYIMEYLASQNTQFASSPSTSSTNSGVVSSPIQQFLARATQTRSSNSQLIAASAPDFHSCIDEAELGLAPTESSPVVNMFEAYQIPVDGITFPGDEPIDPQLANFNDKVNEHQQHESLGIDASADVNRGSSETAFDADAFARLLEEFDQHIANTNSQTAGLVPDLSPMPNISSNPQSDNAQEMDLSFDFSSFIDEEEAVQLHDLQNQNVVTEPPADTRVQECPAAESCSSPFNIQEMGNSSTTDSAKVVPTTEPWYPDPSMYQSHTFNFYEIVTKYCEARSLQDPYTGDLSKLSDEAKQRALDAAVDFWDDLPVWWRFLKTSPADDVPGQNLRPVHLVNHPTKSMVQLVTNPEVCLVPKTDEQRERLGHWTWADVLTKKVPKRGIGGILVGM